MISPVKLWRNQKKVADLVGKTGTIVAFTLIRVPPSGFTDQAPYPVALVELDESLPAGRQGRITAQLVDLPAGPPAGRAGRQVGKDDLTGMKVITVVRRITKPNTEGVIPYGIKVKPL